MSEGEIILINKPYDWTSFDVVKYVRKAFPNEKVGHAGTLDPLATGLLVICTGKMTKKITEIQSSEKEYTGSFMLGATTPSYDLETEISERKDSSHVTAKMIELAVKKFIGEIEQTPPSHSAAKINGRRAYSIARKGENVELASKKVFIKEFEVDGFETLDLRFETNPMFSDLKFQISNLKSVNFRIVCSKGTYIRSIVNDFGKELGCGAYLNSLCRTRIGNFCLKDAIDPKLFQRYMPETEHYK